MLNISSQMSAQMQFSLVDEGGLALQTGLTSAYSSKYSDGQWMEKRQENDKAQEPIVTTRNEDNDVNAKLVKTKNYNGSKRVHQCPMCLKRFCAPSKLKRHCLIHTNQRPFQCSICCRAFRERSHLKVHIRTHTNPEKRTRSLHRYKENSVTCNLASKSKLKPSSKQSTGQDDTKSTDKEMSTVHQDQYMVTENMVSQKIIGDCNDSCLHLPDSFLNEGGWDCHTGWSSAYFSKPSEGQWMEENQKTEEQQEANLTTQNKDNDVHSKVWQSKKSVGSKRVYYCPVCRKRFGAPSELKRHCLIHTNQRPFQCPICCRAFRERSHLRVHFSTHNIREKRSAPSIQSYRVNSVPCNQASKSRLKSSPNQTTAQDDTKSTDKEKSTEHQDEKMFIKNMASQIISCDCSESDACVQDSFLNKKGWVRHTGLSSVYLSKPSEGQWMEEIQESEMKQESSVSTQSEDDVNIKVLQSKKSDGNKRVYDCPVCRKRFGAPSELKRHCLIHTNQRPFQCPICCRAFRERSHLKVHIRTHDVPVKRRTPSLQSYRDNIVSCSQASKSQPSPKFLTAHNDTSSTNKQKSTVQQDQNVLPEDMLSQKICGDCNDSGVHFPDSLLIEGGWDCRTGLSSAYSSKPSESQWMEEIQESEEEREANLTTQNEDKDVNEKLLQRKNSNVSKRVYDCPVCHKRFGAPSELKRHCLIHTNQRPFQCSICCRAFRERSHLKVHIRTHTNPVKRRTPSLQSYRDNIVSCNRPSKSQPSPKFLTAHNDTTSKNKQKSTVQEDQNVLTEDMLSKKICGDYNDSGVHFPDTLLIEGGWDRHTGQSSAYSSKPSESQWMEENQESQEEREASVTTQNEDKDVNEKVLQRNNSNVNKRVYDCPVCHKKFDAPSELKRHCLIHTNQRPFQCSICCRAFRERSQLKVHIRTHTNPVKRRTRSLQSYKNNSVTCYQTSKSRLKPCPKYLTVQNIASSAEKQQSASHQDDNRVTEIVACQIISGDCSESDGYLEDSLLNKEGLDLHTGLSSAYSPKPPESQWMEEIQESEEKQEASVTTQNEDNGANSKVWQSKNCNRSKRVYYCPVCRKQFGAPSELKSHCLIHTNQRPFQCSICCRAFRERSHLKVHFSTHKIREKRRAPSIQSYRVNSVPCNQASKSRLKSSPKQTTAQNDTKSTDKEKSTEHQDEKMVIENMASQIISCDCSESDACLLDSLLNKKGWDCHTGLSSLYFSKPSEGQWMEEIQESEMKQESSVSTQSEDDVNVKVLQSKKSDGNKRVYDCPVCHKRFGAPSELKRHCLIHTNQRPIQCPICCRAFRERSHLKVHIRTHTNPVKRRTRSLQGYKDNSVPCYQTSKSRFKPCPKYLTIQNNTSSTEKQQSASHQDDNRVTEIVACQIISGDYSESDGYLEESLLNKEGLDLHTGQSSAYSLKPSESQWMEEIQKSEEEQEASVTTQNEENGVNSKVWQSKNCNRSKIVYDCPVCHKRFGAPSELKRHCFIHTNQRPFQCPICCRAFRERSHLKVHIRTHDVPVKRRTPSLQSYRDNIVSCNQASKSKPSPKFLTAHNDTTSKNKQKSTVQEDQNVLPEDMLSQKICGDYNDSGVHFPDTLLIEGGWDHHTGQSSAYSSKPSESQWMEENQESQEEREACVTTQNEDKDVNEKVLQRNNSNVNKRVYDCPVCHKKFDAPSELKRHCLIHTNQRPFQCPICCRAFRERSHLKVHIRTHTNPVKRRTQSLQSYKNNSVTCYQTSKSRLKPCPKYLTVQNNTSSTDKQQSASHQDDNRVTEIVACQIISGDCSESDGYLEDSLLNKEGLDLHTGLSSAYSPKPPESQWMEEIQESEEKQEASVTTQNEDNGANSKVWQSKNCNRSKRVYYCPVCSKQFGAPSELKRHCLIHTNQRPFQCPICCRAFRERSHLKVHFSTHNIREKRRAPSIQSYRVNSVPCNQASKSRLKSSPKQTTAQDDTKSTDREKSTEHQDEKMVIENMASQIISCDCSESDACLLDSLLNKKGWDCHTGLSSLYFSKPSEGQWMEEIQESEMKQESSFSTQSEDDVNVKVLQSKKSDGNKIVYDCPVCHKRFGAPSELKRHCLIHTNQRPIQCPICCRAFRERSHLKVHIRTHTNPVKRTTRSLQSYKDNSVTCFLASKSKIKPSPKYLTVQNNASSAEKQQSASHQDDNRVTEIVACQIISGDCSESDGYLEDSLLNKEGLDLHTVLSSAYSPKPPESQWMEEIQESEEEQEASVTTQNEDNGANSKVWQSKNCNRSKRVYDCPVCRKRFGAPSELKRHCLIHTNQRPFQCPICCRAFRERSHLKVHFSTHNIRENRRAPSIQSYRVNSVPCNQASKSRLKSSPNQTTAQDDTKSTDKEKSTEHQDEKMFIENMASQIISCDCSESDACVQDSFLNKKGWDRHTGLSSLYFSKPSEGQWMEEIQESEMKQESSVSTQSEDDVNVKVLQSKKSDGNKRVYDCPVCRKRFGAPSELKRHCLIHTNQRPFQCPICCRAFRERSHLKVHIRAHTNPVKRTPSLHTYKDNIVSCNRAAKSKLKPSPKCLTAHNDTTSTNKQKSTVQQDQNVLTEDILSQKICGDYNDSCVYLSKSTSPLENVENNKSVLALMHKTDILLDGKKASDIVPFGRVSDCPPKTDSSLRHCAPESRTEEKWELYMDDVEDFFVDSDTVVTQCVPGSHKSSSCQYQQNPDVPRIPEVVVELEDFEDPGDCFIKTPHDIPFCRDCSRSFRTVRNLYAHNCTNGYPEGEVKKSHQCDICFKFFSTPSKLKSHYVTHTGQRPFLCTQCQKSYTQPHHLKTHMLSHR
ncbi:zinc finger protein 236-like isoform X2 [Carassius auratus]|nr:zinc finger protein 236-like isoform X2 [Carassius auratus]XP_026147238.1 zinc finger protein 236-like isoform X2 [Carassius auratus]XP_026147240.1 zinc finger protein 236-like isoform X2 [Carassius auratus]